MHTMFTPGEHQVVYLIDPMPSGKALTPASLASLAFMPGPDFCLQRSRKDTVHGM
jgi:hypothetical protein